MSLQTRNFPTRRRGLRLLAAGLAALLLAACTREPETPPAEPEPPPVPFEASALQAVLTSELKDDRSPADQVSVVAEDVEELFLVLRYDGPAEAEMTLRWHAVNTELWPAGELLDQSHGFELSPGRWEYWAIRPRQHRINGFLLGEYRVDVVVNEQAVKSLSFTVTPIMPAVEAATSENVPVGANIALAALGGRIELTNVKSPDEDWLERNLIDGMASKDYFETCSPTCGWAADPNTELPYEIVFAFHNSQPAVVQAVVLDTVTDNHKNSYGSSPRHVEVWGSTTSPYGDFVQLGAGRIPPTPGEYVFSFFPRSIKYLKLVIRSFYGGRAELGEVRIIEPATAAETVLGSLPRNLAAPGLGGAIVWYTSHDKFGPYGGDLIDGAVSETSGWASGDLGLGPGQAGYLPQDFVFAFHGDQAALIDQVVLNPLSGPKHEVPANDPEGRPTWVKSFSLAVSMESPFDGFEEVGRFTLAQEPREQAFPVGRKARFLRLRLLENYGGPVTRLGEVKILEGSAPDYTSIFRTGAAVAAQRLAAPAVSFGDGDVLLESEPNDAPGQANQLELGRRTRGVVDPTGELDHFRITVPGEGRQVLTMELAGRPDLRTSVSLLDPRGAVRYQVDPGREALQQARFSLAVDPGDYLVRVTQPPVSMVLIWDTSGSMAGSEGNLQRAVESYLDQVRPGDRVNLIRFSDGAEVLLDQFTSDRAALKTATEGKFEPGGGTALYDAISKGMELLEGEQGNRAIILMTDGADTGSNLSHPGLWHLLREKRTRLYTIGLGAMLRSQISYIGTSGHRGLAHAALATNGRFFFSPSSDQLGAVYRQIAEDLGQRPVYYLRPALASGAGELAVVATGERLPSVSAPPQVELILDASGSMKRDLGGKPMIDVAKEVLTQVVESLPDEIQVGLRVYGHRIREGQPGDCEDSELLFPFAPLNRARLLGGVQSIKALGTTPIAYSLRQVAADFGSAPGEKLVVLLTDGKEECDGDIAAAVKELQDKGLKLRLDVVGFALADEATKEELRKVAAMTGGRFFDAQNSQGLRQAIDQAMGVPFTVVDAAGQRVASGLTGEEPVSLPEGIYTVLVQAAGEPVRIERVAVTAGRSTRVELHKDGQEIGIQVREGDPAPGTAEQGGDQ